MACPTQRRPRPRAATAAALTRAAAAAARRPAGELVLSALQHMAVRRRCKNPFEDEKVARAPPPQLRREGRAQPLGRDARRGQRPAASLAHAALLRLRSRPQQPISNFLGRKNME